MADPLDTVLRIRRVTVDDAKRGLAALLQAEDAAQGAAAEAEARVVREGQAATDLGAGDEAVEAYAAWLPVGRAQAEAARASHDRLRCEVALARAALTVARGAAEAAQRLLETRAGERRRELERRSQVEMDEVASRRSFHD